MQAIKYSEKQEIDFDKMLTLYQDADWTAYTNHPEVLKKAIENSLYILTAWSNDQLVGFIRAVGDGHTIIYIQDIIVLNNFQRQGIGKELLERVLLKYNKVRQILLLTDSKPETISFYESAGLKQTNDLNLTSFIKLN